MTKRQVNTLKIVGGVATVFFGKKIYDSYRTIPDFFSVAISGPPSKWSQENTHDTYLIDYDFEDVNSSDVQIIASVNNIISTYPDQCLYIGATGNKLGRLDGHKGVYDKLFHLARTKNKAKMKKIEKKFIKEFWPLLENDIRYSTGLTTTKDGWYYLYITVRLDGFCVKTESKQVSYLQTLN